MAVPPIGGPTHGAAGIVTAVFAAGLVADRLAGGRTSWRTGPTDRGTFWLIQAGQLVALFAGLEVPRWTRAARLPASIWPAGVGIMAAGIGLRVWSVRSLGASFHRDVRAHSEQTLVTTGPYRSLRHPSYTAVLLMFAGLGVAQADAASLAVLVVLPTVVYLRRIKVEEAVMYAALGRSYRAFAERRKRLIPWVY